MFINIIYILEFLEWKPGIYPLECRYVSSIAREIYI
nr:MAG TPA: hypothetical protein [Caudoviricetes sp.]